MIWIPESHEKWKLSRASLGIQPAQCEEDKAARPKPQDLKLSSNTRRGTEPLRSPTSTSRPTISSWVLMCRASVRPRSAANSTQRCSASSKTFQDGPPMSTKLPGRRVLLTSSRFKERTGHAQPPHKEMEPESGYPIGNWVFTQRYKRRSKKLRPDRQKRLAEIPLWSWDPHDDKWQEGFSHLVEYEKIFGTTGVPQKAKSPDGYPIGTWASKQRRDGKAGRLDPARVAQLDGIGFIWDTR